MPTKQQKTPPAAENRLDEYYYVYTTKEGMQKFLARSEQEMDMNYPIFRRRLPDLMKKHKGEFVLMRGGKMLGFFDSRRDAEAEGNKRFKDCVFSALEVSDEVFDMGIFSRV